MFLVFAIAVWTVRFLPKHTPANSIETPVSQEKTMVIKVFFANGKTDPGFLDCTVVHPATRTIPYTVGTAQASLTELIKGPTAQEVSDGFVTSIDPSTKIQSLSIKNGIAYVDFSKDLGNKNTGLCAGEFIKSQIEQTLLQFSTIKKVQVSIDGDSEFVQP